MRHAASTLATVVFAALFSGPSSAELPRWPTVDSLNALYETGSTDELVAAGILASIGAGSPRYAVEDFFFKALQRDPFHVLAAHSLLVHCAKTENVPLCASDAYLRDAVEIDATNGAMWVAYAALKHKYADANTALPLIRAAADAAVYNSYFASYMSLFNELLRAHAPLLPTHHQQLVIGFSGRSVIETQMYGICQSETDARWTTACHMLGRKIETGSSMPTMVGIGQKFQISMLERKSDDAAAEAVKQRRDALVQSLDAPNPSEYFADSDAFWYELTETQINDGELAGVRLIRERIGNSEPIDRWPQQGSNDTLVEQVAEGIVAAAIVRARVAQFILSEKRAPIDRREAGLTSDPTDNRDEHVRSVDVIGGQIVITYGHHADNQLHGLTLVLTPYISETMSLAWQCGYSTPPVGLVAIGKTNVSSTVPPDFMPGICVP